MARPTNKASLLAAGEKEYQALEQLLATLTPQQMTQTSAPGEWSVKDILAHLYEWQRMVAGWYAAGQRGETPAVPAEGYKWNQIPALNQAIYEKYRHWPLEDVLSHWRASHQQTQAAIAALSEEELFTPGRYAWANQNALGAYFVSCTSSHYLWARNETRKRFPARPKKA